MIHALPVLPGWIWASVFSPTYFPSRFTSELPLTRQPVVEASPSAIAAQRNPLPIDMLIHPFLLKFRTHDYRQRLARLRFARTVRVLVHDVVNIRRRRLRRWHSQPN